MIQGDSRDPSVLNLDPESVDCFITSPPYFNLKRYDEGATGEVGQGQKLEDYLADLKEISARCHRLAKDTSVLWLILDTFRPPATSGGLGELEPLPFRVSDVVREAGWRLQEIIVWEKNKTLPYSGHGKLRNLIEYVLLFTKTQHFKHRPFRVAERHGPRAQWMAGWPERYHPLGKRPPNIWKIAIPTQGMWAHSERLHFCPLPQALVARCIELTTDKGDLVVDPFAGIGTVPAQAEAMGRRGFGIDLNPKFIEIFRERILPEFQAAWESQAELRELARKDQTSEAETLLTLRALKAGKELSKHLERWAQEKSSDFAAAVETIFVDAPSEFDAFLDVDEGLVGKPSVRLVLLVEANHTSIEDLQVAVEEALHTMPLSGLGLDLSAEVRDRSSFVRKADDGIQLFEFEQSRRASLTRPIILTTASALPRLITNVALNRVVNGDGLTPLDLARKEAERRVIMAELAATSDTSELASRLGVGNAELQELLVEHGIDQAQQTFGIPIDLPLVNRG